MAEIHEFRVMSARQFWFEVYPRMEAERKVKLVIKDGPKQKPKERKWNDGDE